MTFAPAALTVLAVIVAISPLATPRGRAVGLGEPGPGGRPGIRRHRERWFRRRRRPMVVSPEAIADWADRLSRHVRHGSSLHAAIRDAPPSDDALRRLSEPFRQRLDRGATVVDACDEWSDHLGENTAPRAELLVTFASVVGAAAAVGGSAAAPLDRVAAAMRRHVSDDLERGAQSAQARLSARVLTLVPLAVLALLLATDDDVREIVASPTGAATVAAGLAINAAGAFWMHRIAGGPLTLRHRGRP